MSATRLMFVSLQMALHSGCELSFRPTGLYHYPDTLAERNVLRIAGETAPPSSYTSLQCKGIFYPLTRNDLEAGHLDSLTGKFGQKRTGGRYFPPNLRSVFWVAFFMKDKAIGDITQRSISWGSCSSSAESG